MNRERSAEQEVVKNDKNKVSRKVLPNNDIAYKHDAQSVDS